MRTLYRENTRYFGEVLFGKCQATIERSALMTEIMGIAFGVLHAITFSCFLVNSFYLKHKGKPVDAIYNLLVAILLCNVIK